jgi:hypothetical protein
MVVALYSSSKLNSSCASGSSKDFQSNKCNNNNNNKCNDIYI